jgi:HSP20 family protein
MSTKSLVKSGETFPGVFEDFFKPWNDWFSGNLWGKMTQVPAVNVTDNKDNFQVSLAAPGLKKDDFRIDVDGNLLTISSEKEENKEDKTEKFTRKEYNYSSFSRSFSLPDEVIKEKIDAEYKDGILKLTLPKKEEAVKATGTKHIAVK